MRDPEYVLGAYHHADRASLPRIDRGHGACRDSSRYGETQSGIKRRPSGPARKSASEDEIHEDDHSPHHPARRRRRRQVATPWVSRAQQLKAEYKLSVVGNRPIPLSEGAFQWAELVTQRTDGRINVKVYPGSQLVGGDQTRELVAMRQGIIDFTVSSTINLSPQIKEMNLYSMPFLIRTTRPMTRSSTASGAGPVQGAGAARRGAARLGRERLP